MGYSRVPSSGENVNYIKCTIIMLIEQENTVTTVDVALASHYCYNTRVKTDL